MKEQKAWLMQQARAHAKVVAARRSETDASPGQETRAADTVTPSPPPPRPPEATADELQGKLLDETPKPATEPNNSVDCIVDGVEALILAGGDVPTLASLSGADLAVALKGLGFKGLAQRRRLEQSLKEWQAQQ